jgi:hypothetical protein
MIVAYADPPYIGQARKHYGKQPDYAGEVDHETLVRRLVTDYEHWALSCSSTSLQYLLGLAPAGVRVGAWVKPFAVFKVGVNPAYAWEPVLFYGARKRSRSEWKVFDWVSVGVNPATPRGPRFVVGAKPEAFCFWLFALMGMQPWDELVDLFPGSGAVTAAWGKWQQQLWPSLIDAEDSAAG